MGIPLYDFGALLFVAPALILAFIAQMWVSSAYAHGKQAAAKMSGFLAARHILDAAGLRAVEIESIPGQLSDHYDPRAKVLRLSEEVYHGRSLSSVGIAAHEAGTRFKTPSAIYRWPFATSPSLQPASARRRACCW